MSDDRQTSPADDVVKLRAKRGKQVGDMIDALVEEGTAQTPSLVKLLDYEAKLLGMFAKDPEQSMLISPVNMIMPQAKLL